jgi:poly(A) polymerase
MAERHVLERVLPIPADVELFARVAAIEQALGRAPDSLLRLAALTGARTGSALPLRDRFKLSNSDYERLARMTMPDRAFDPETTEREAKAFIYRHSESVFLDGVVLAWARKGSAPEDTNWRARFGLPARWKAPQLPVRGTDVVALGIAEGPAVGRVVRAFEDWWIAEDFPHDPAAIAATLARLARAPGAAD